MLTAVELFKEGVLQKFMDIRSSFRIEVDASKKQVFGFFWKVKIQHWISFADAIESVCWCVSLKRFS
jgi:hypothetical protein